MDHHEQAHQDAYKRMQTFGVNNAADFSGADPASVKAKNLFTQLDGVVSGLDAAATNQTGGSSSAHSGTTGKKVQRAGVMTTLRGIHKSAIAIAGDQNKPEIAAKFPLPDEHNDQSIVASANAFATAAAPYQADFVALGHDATFITDLQNQVTAFQSAGSDQSSGAQARSGATNSVDPLLHQGKVIARQLDAWAHNKYKSDANKMGAWITASHVEHKSATAKTTPDKTAKGAAK